MRLSRLRSSRSTIAVLATAWLPYSAVCCVVSPFADAGAASKPTCHVLAGVSPVSAETKHDSGHHHEGHGSHHDGSGHHGTSEGRSGSAPAQTCCDLTGKAEVKPEKPTEGDAHPILTVVVSVDLTRAQRELSQPASRLVDAREHSPPIYLRNAAFLI